MFWLPRMQMFRNANSHPHISRICKPRKMSWRKVVSHRHSHTFVVNHWLYVVAPNTFLKCPVTYICGNLLPKVLVSEKYKYILKYIITCSLGSECLIYVTLDISRSSLAWAQNNCFSYFIFSCVVKYMLIVDSIIDISVSTFISPSPNLYLPLPGLHYHIVCVHGLCI